MDEDGLTVMAIAKLEGTSEVVKLMAAYGGKGSKFVSAHLAYSSVPTGNQNNVAPHGCSNRIT